jgi:tRNA A22 N-methylase
VSHEDDFDEVDAEHIRQVLTTRGWQIIAEAIRRQRDTLVGRLVTEKDAREIAVLQGGIATCSVVLSLPAELVRQATGNTRA